MGFSFGEAFRRSGVQAFRIGLVDDLSALNARTPERLNA
jgi:hypothetical protein